jgi:hypothetical protein
MLFRYGLFLPIALVSVLGLAGSVAAQERAKWVAPQSGIWAVTGVDEDNVVWTGSTLRLVRHGRMGSRVAVRGYFTWRSADGETVGREYVKGSFERANGRMLISGYRVRNERGELALGRYLGFLAARGRRITRGNWDGNDVVKGTWSATFSK